TFVELGGTLTPAPNVTPWEVRSGSAVTNLDATIKKGKTTVDLHTNNDNPIEVLTIRPKVKKAFLGAPNITPQIDYHGAIDVAKFSNGKAPLTLDVKDESGAKIGKLETTVSVEAFRSVLNHRTGGGNAAAVYAKSAGHAFYGGVGRTPSSISEVIRCGEITDAHEHYDTQDGRRFPPVEATFSPDSFIITYSGVYVSYIAHDQVIKITLDKAVDGDTPIKWKASLPVTVTYS
ncbi:fimbrial protein, partial [Escherichia coli]|uniref:F4 family fimbrial subunit n=1 Tax=Escherichia coli TaxID=562 RepID=UPI0028790073